MLVTELFARLGLDIDEAAFELGDKAIAALKGGLTALGAVAGATAVGLTAAVVATAGAADKFDDAAKITGVAVDRLQELNYAAGFAGLTFEALQGALGAVNRQVREAAGGNKELAAAFAAAGIATRDSNGHLRSADAILADVADKIAATQDPTERVALATQLLGKQGAALIPVLEGGSAGLAAMGQEARELGVIFGEETVAEAAEFEDTLDRVKHAVAGLVYTIGAPLIRPMREALGGFVAWVRENREIIKLRIEQVVTVLGTAFKVLFAVLKPGIALLAFVVRYFELIALTVLGALTPALLANIGAVISALGWYAALSIAMVAAAAKAAAAWVIAAAPFVALGLAIAAVILIVEDLWHAINGGESAIMKLGAVWTGFLERWLADDTGDGWFMTALKALVWMLTDIDERLPQTLEGWKETFLGFFAWLWEQVKQVPGALLDALKGGPWGALVGMATGQLPTLFGGGAASPAASVAASPTAGPPMVLAPNFRADFTTHAAPGMDPEQVAGVTRDVMDQWYATKMTETLVAVDQ
jgi:hypothetical protein